MKKGVCFNTPIEGMVCLKHDGSANLPESKGTAE